MPKGDILPQITVEWSSVVPMELKPVRYDAAILGILGLFF